MSQNTVRVREETYRLLRQISRAEGTSMPAVLERAVDAYRRHLFLTDLNAAYAALRQDPEAASALGDELRAWDATLGDGLPADEDRVSTRGRP